MSVKQIEKTGNREFFEALDSQIGMVKSFCGNMPRLINDLRGRQPEKTLRDLAERGVRLVFEVDELVKRSWTLGGAVENGIDEMAEDIAKLRMSMNALMGSFVLYN